MQLLRELIHFCLESAREVGGTNRAGSGTRPVTDTKSCGLSRRPGIRTFRVGCGSSCVAILPGIRKSRHPKAAAGNAFGWRVLWDALLRSAAFYLGCLRVTARRYTAGSYDPHTFRRFPSASSLSGPLGATQPCSQPSGVTQSHTVDTI